MPPALQVLAPVRLLPVQLAAAQIVPVGWRWKKLVDRRMMAS